MRARCSTTQGGTFACTFKEIDGDGFEISASGKPTLRLYPDEGDDIANGFTGYAEFGDGHGVPLPGRYFICRDDDDCWVNDATGERLRITILRD